ncbi:FlxA-like family protein [Variovorax sp. HJSM1_2]|uniref:FlxA-like family protein n=1 Tax=Variovorax sp. HJSM1_2 TaxID=3366263 RepID=UPI003BDFBA98
MQVSFRSTGGANQGASSAAAIARLEKQMRELTEQLKAVVWEDMDPKLKEQRIQMLQGMIQMVQQQIMAVQRAEELRQMQEQQARAAEQQKATRAESSRQSGLGYRVDVYA